MRRSDKNAGRTVKLIPVPMYIFWQAVLAEVNRRLVAKYTYQGYIANIYRGTQRNAEIEEVIDECVVAVNKDFEKRGVRSKYSIESRT
jgi:hypothetical protein